MLLEVKTGTLWWQKGQSIKEIWQLETYKYLVTEPQNIWSKDGWNWREKQFYKNSWIAFNNKAFENS